MPRFYKPSEYAVITGHVTEVDTYEVLVAGWEPHDKLYSIFRKLDPCAYPPTKNKQLKIRVPMTKEFLETNYLGGMIRWEIQLTAHKFKKTKTSSITAVYIRDLVNDYLET